ncbi:hypothetical protein DH2020_015049 [Rehmannia glutinosa]|uniref:PWWP domain-containing protein n=1 Tax=Rehmannia glutinosa TaxID=99300 RepID=A0ABR0X1E4_REHGL
MDVVNVSSGISGESNEGVSGGMVDGSESKTLAEEIPSDKGVLSEGVRVSEESMVLDGELNSVSGSGWNVVESGSLEISEKHDPSKSRVVEMMSRDNGWGRWGFMDLVGRVLDGRFSMDEEVEDVKTSGDGREANLVTGMNAWQGVIGEPASVNGNDVEITDIDKDSDKLKSDCLVEETGFIENQNLVSNELVPDGKLETHEESNVSADNGNEVERTDNDKDSDTLNSDCLVEETGLNGNQDLVSNELVPDGTLEGSEVIDVNFLVPKTRGEHHITEKEGEYYVSDLVWGKVRSHPWWPGQIFEPTDASDKAAKHFKRGSYLIAYFGDQTFAWNEGSKIKPFRLHFSQMEKQSNSDGFSHAVHCALDEVARRVELGLSCPCLPEEVQDKFKIQVVSNAGIWEKSSIRAGGDILSSAATFSPGELVQFLESVAGCPQSKTDRLQFTTVKSQLLAFNRWKGHYALSVLEECGGLLEDDTQVTLKGDGKDFEGAYDFSSKKRKSTARGGSSQKRKHPSGDEDCRNIKQKHISALMSSSSSTLQNVDGKKSIKRTGRKPVSETINSIPSNPKVKRRKSLLSTSPGGDISSQSKRSGEKSGETTLRSRGGTLASDGGGESQMVEIIPEDIPTPDVILSKLILAAKIPMQGFNVMISEVDFFVNSGIRFV